MEEHTMSEKKEVTTTNVAEMAEKSDVIADVDSNENTEGAKITNVESAAIPARRERRQKAPNKPTEPTAPIISTAPILTLTVGAEVETHEDRQNAIWHEIKNSQVSKTPLTGILGKIEFSKVSGLLSVVDFKGQRIVIPLSEMNLDIERAESKDEQEHIERATRLLNKMMGAEIDFIVRGISNAKEERAAVASRKAAMHRLRRRYYLNIGAYDKPQVHPGRIVEARIIAVSKLAIRVEIFGVETSIHHRNLEWGPVADCRDDYFVGDSVQVRVRSIEGNNIENLVVYADVKSLTENTVMEKLLALKPQTNCIGKVVNTGNGATFIRLVDGVMAIAHKCFDRRKPGNGDDVMFVVTKIDVDTEFAVGVIARIVKRNI
jgi:ribosomal protein S1